MIFDCLRNTIFSCTDVTFDLFLTIKGSARHSYFLYLSRKEKKVSVTDNYNKRDNSIKCFEFMAFFVILNSLLAMVSADNFGIANNLEADQSWQKVGPALVRHS